MPKSVKIDVCGTMTEVDDVFSDPAYRAQGSHDPWALSVPSSWGPEYRLCLVCKGIFDEDDTINLTATYLYQNLRKKAMFWSRALCG